MKNEVAITGIGVVSPIGNNVYEFKDNLFSGLSGVKPIRGEIVPKTFPIPYAGVVKNGSKNGNGFKPLDIKERAIKFISKSLKEAINFYGKGDDFDGFVISATKAYGFETITNIINAQSKNIDNYEVEYISEIIDTILNEFNFKSISSENQIFVDAACSSGNQAVGMAAQRIQYGYWKRAIVGAADVRLIPSNFMSFHMLRALNIENTDADKASKPFDLNRKGFVRGEGAAFLMLESLDSALSRKAKIFGLVSGFGNTCDAYRLTDGRDDLLCVIKAMENAILNSNLKVKDINVISAHGTSTKLNDKLESRAIKKLFNSHAKNLKITSLKSQIGHSTIAAGIIETISCLLMLNENKIAPTINYETPDPDCDLDYTPNKSQDYNFNYVLNNNFGFGGQNNCIIIKKFAGNT